MAWFRRKEAVPASKPAGGLEVLLEDAGPCRRIMHVSVPPERVADEYARVVSLFQREARVPGFRKGKAPLEVIEARFAREIAEEVQDRLLPRFYYEALAQKGIEAEEVIGVSNTVFGRTKGLSFKVTIDVPPEFELPRYTKILVKRERVEVTEKDVEMALKEIREALVRYEDVKERPAKEADLLLIDYSGNCEGRRISEIAPDCPNLGDGKDFWVVLGEPEFLPGFRQGLIGARRGDAREIEVRFPPDFRVASVAGKQATYSVTVKEIREPRLPELDDPRLLERCGAKTVAELRETVRKNLVAAAQQRERSRQRDQIAKYLLENTNFDLPAAVVEREARLTVRAILRRLVRQGVTREELEARQGDIAGTALEASRERVKLSYILRRIARAEGLTVTDQEVDQRLREIATGHGMEPEQLRRMLEEHGGLDRLRDEILCDKAMDLLLEKARIKE
ncbi:MAG: trigger factor [Kiritimatiellae bacterium]|nr:trigger factor [Kiritimatiellia bacterium]